MYFRKAEPFLALPFYYEISEKVQKSLITEIRNVLNHHLCLFRLRNCGPAFKGLTNFFAISWA
jgi:hypothetical protein